jgi:hypothetical protein
MSAKRKSTPRRKSKPAARAASAGGIYLGFSLQATRFLVHLLRAEHGDHICLEVFEDVGTEKGDGTVIAEQNKSNLVTNPLTDRSLQFWKTMGNWIDAVQDSVLDPEKTTFVIYTSNPAGGTIAQSFHDAVDIDSAKAAISNAETLLGSSSSDKDGVGKEDTSYIKHLRIVLAGDRDSLVQMIIRFRLDVGKGHPHDELPTLFLAKLVSEDAYEDVVRWSHGWVKQRVDRLLEAREPARVSQSEFHNALLNYVQRHDRLDILRSFAKKPSDEQIDDELSFRDYVRQLRLIDMDDVDVLAAINDFLRAATDRTTWAERGMIGVDSVEEMASELEQAWRNRKDRNAIAFSDKTDTQRGRLLYGDCLAHSTKLDRQETPEHFVRGSWHVLSDDRTIGWHPHYTSELDSVSLSPSEENISNEA